MLSEFTFSQKNIIDIAAAVVVWALLCAFFIRKRKIRMLLLFSAIFLVFVTVDVLDVMFGLPLARDMALLLAVFMVVSIVVVYQSDFKVMFFDLAKGHERGG